ncbi:MULTISPECIES: efflux RND transporter periplasmic adaptor subunit [Methylocaldum]|jgi:cobalt-zinc-cadmium efflux system membrane fusion protein|uniref:efflux RND transporter periplasmic adaptor subunit n=1 Tax=unclassified Methylocaldum TaxID=2622260 RepID=UPI00098A78B7|nr:MULTISPECIES: efflux RND transporter periplasmic adaptor subunit [unclassified Methylocaldum]MBP1148384.1 cobalt-zinc-cadmium efflux system membrane fusion protein [Methylocaldum sp. RMAD-M]MDV3242791.1 efflux RND transporter periplasmic adaptor subunit [Methylocaldum sp.]MVF22870.1 efflux RND transporter periplasmic adaptor subunit [Methylocaldum sp. BRCS4]
MKKPIFFALLALGVWPVFGQQELQNAETTAEIAVKAPPSLLERLKIEPVTSTEIGETLHLPGRVTLNEHRVARVGPSVTGRVTNVMAFIGQNVRQGERLATINSTELSIAQAAYLKAKTQMNLHRLAVDRARRLLKADVISRAELTERESELTEVEVEVRASADQLAVMGMSENAIQRLSNSGQIDSVIPVTATLSGTVIEREISIGQIVQPADDLFTIADLSEVWVVAEAPEQKAYLVEIGGRAEVQIPALPGQKITGKVIYVADIVNPSTRTVTVRMELENPERKIKPEMLATMVIHRPRITSLNIPAKAVVRTGDRDYVFVHATEDQFVLTPVSLGPDLGGLRRVIAGLTEGQRIVVDGAFHLNNERIRKELE